MAFIFFLETLLSWFARRFLLLSAWGGAIALGQWGAGVRTVSLGEGIGFCLDQVPPVLEGSRFTAPSTLDQTTCTSLGHTWCPLNNYTDSYSNGTHSTLYYFFSACCQDKKQFQALIPDTTTGLPSCRKYSDGTAYSSSICMRHDWRDKVMKDFVTGHDAGYDFKTAPGTVVTDPLVRGGLTPTCICQPTDANCQNKSADGKSCLLCATDLACAADKVTLSVHFFKIHSLDLKTSEFFFSGWIRQEWHEPRIIFDYQCYGGLEYVEAMGDPGSLENSEIWTPDIELYNAESNIWQGSIAGRLASVYSANGPHSKGGYVFFSRPGLIRALCKFEGVLMFPYDTLLCQLEFAAFLLDGRVQDIVGGAATWVDSPDSTSISGITAGSSFQDYGIMAISSQRWVAFYACCPSSPYPEIIYTVKFKRSASYYVLRLVIPAMVLATVGFLSFWMPPEIGERLGFCMVVILAIVTNDMVAMEMIPVSEQRVLLDLLTNHCKLFSFYALAETAIVLYLYHLKVDTWKEALVPSWALNMISLDRWFKSPGHGTKPSQAATRRQSSHSKASSAHSRQSKLASLHTEAVVRRQLWLRAFYTIDEDFSGTLTAEELSEFIDLMTHSCKHATGTMVSLHDADGSETLNEEEFLEMCETELVKGRTYEELERVVSGFLQSQERKDAAMVDVWHKRALNVDRFSRLTFPPGFVLALVQVYSLTEKDLHDFEASWWPYTWFVLSEFIPFIVGITWIVSSTLYETCMRGCRTKAPDAQETRCRQKEAALEGALDLSSINIDEKPMSGKPIGRSWSFTPSSSEVQPPQAANVEHRYHAPTQFGEQGRMLPKSGTRVDPGGFNNHVHAVGQSYHNSTNHIEQLTPVAESQDMQGDQRKAVTGADRIRKHLAAESGNSDSARRPQPQVRPTDRQARPPS